jgi:hypothetical protein
MLENSVDILSDKGRSGSQCNLGCLDSSADQFLSESRYDKAGVITGINLLSLIHCLKFKH